MEISRVARGFKAQVAVVALAVSTMLLVGCAGAATPSQQASQGPTQPKYGGVLRTGAYSEFPASWDPVYTTGGTDTAFFIAAFSTLVRIDPRDGKIIGDLAESWEVTNEGKTYVFKLHDNVMSHDGKLVGAEDVKISMERALARNKSSIWGSRISTVDVRDPRTVAINIKTPFAGFLASLTANGSLSIVPKGVFDKIGGADNKITSPKDAIGTGPFKITDFAVGAGTKFTRFDNYFVKGKPYLDGIEHIGILDPSTRMAAYRTGNIDYLYFISIEAPDATVIKKNLPNNILYSLPESRYWQFHMPNKPPWSDIRVRQAINLVFDRQAAVNLTEEGVGNAGSYLASRYGGLTGEEAAKLPGFRPNKEEDIKEAKRLLAEAGYPGGTGLALPLTFRNVSHYQDVTLVYSGQLEKALGFKFTLDPPPDDATWKQRETNCLHNGYVHRTVTGQDPEDQLNAHVSKAGYYNQKCGWSIPEIDALYAEQAVTADSAKRKVLLQQIDKILMQKLPFIQLHYSGYWETAWPFVKDAGIGVISDIRSDQWHIYTWLDK